MVQATRSPCMTCAELFVQIVGLDQFDSNPCVVQATPSANHV